VVKIGALARSLSVPVPTLRRWTEEFAEGLSPEARGGDGRPREFSLRDQRVLRRAREILSDGDVTYAQVRLQLVQEGLLPPPTAPAAAPSPEEPASEDERQAAERFVLRLVDRAAQPWIERVERLEREVQALRQELASLQAAPSPSSEEAPEAAPGRRRWIFG
jgi:DNA-binding transcriptional MerR regulator